MYAPLHIKPATAPPVNRVVAEPAHPAGKEKECVPHDLQHTGKIKPGNTWHTPAEDGIKKDSNFLVSPKLMYGFGDVPVYAGTTVAIQPKLTINTPDDEYEQEADAVAEKIMRVPDSRKVPVTISPVGIIHRKCSVCGKEEHNTAEEDKKEHLNQQLTIQRKCAACEKEEEEKKKVQRKPSGHTTPVTTDAVSQTLKSPGKPLNKDTRSFMEHRFGFDFSQVRIHDHAQANESAAKINALAYTHQQNIVFAGGQYQPYTQSGRKLLAHELTHTLQQSGSAVKRKGETGSVQSSSARFIVDDDMSPAEGVMTKSNYLSTLNDAVCATVDQELKGTAYSSDNCPYIRSIFARQANNTPAQIEQLAARYEPKTAFAQSAAEMIELILVRVRVAVNQWKQRKSLADVSGDVMGMLAESSVGAPVSGGAGKSDSLQFKSKSGTANNTQSPQAVMHSLGKGKPLDSGTRSRMEGAFGTDFSKVKVHTDSHAANLSGGMNARAFAVGNHIAFGSGEYQPGTLIGDALMAHELAHTIQQSAGEAEQTQMQSAAVSNTLEEDADTSAIGVVANIWALNPKETTKKARPSLKSKLKLQRCTGSKCPDGFSWGIVNRTCAASIGDCTWACVPYSSGGPSISDPYAPRPSLPSRKHTVGNCVGGIDKVNIMCNPLKDEDGNILGRDTQFGEPDQDYTGALAAGAHMNEQRNANKAPQTTDQKPVSGEVRPKDGQTTPPSKPPVPPPVKPVTVEPVKPVTVEPVKPVTVEPVKPVAVNPVKPVTVDPVKPVTDETVKPANTTDPPPTAKAPATTTPTVPTTTDPIGEQIAKQEKDLQDYQQKRTDNGKAQKEQRDIVEQETKAKNEALDQQQKAKTTEEKQASLERARQANQRRQAAVDKLSDLEAERRTIDDEVKKIQKEHDRLRDVKAPRTQEDKNIDPKPPAANNGKSTIGTTPNQETQLRADVTDAAQRGATDIRVNQEQVDASGKRVGINRPDLQYTIGTQRYYVEYEHPNNPRGADHVKRILANDPTAIIVVKLVPNTANFTPGQGVTNLKFP